MQCTIFALKMHEMKFKWKFVAIVIVCFVFWLIGVKQTSNGSTRIIIENEAEIATLKNQLKSALQYRAKYSDSNAPIIYAITPTFTRPVQKAELTRLSQTFSLVPNFHWIIVEDSPTKTHLVEQFLKFALVNYTHLNAETPPKWKFVGNNPNWQKPRGVLQRNTALEWIRSNKKETDNGVVYFADDDNTYNIQLFEEMRDTRTVSVWPVGLVGGLMVEKCIVNSTTGRVTGWNSAWRPERPFPLDMAAFAINLQLLLSKPAAKFSFDVERGYQESALLRYLVKRDEMEPKADGCTKVYVWHTRTEPPVLRDELKLEKYGKEKSNKNIEV